MDRGGTATREHALTIRFAAAAQAVHRTQSAVSMQMKRLEEIIEQPLFEKQGRRTTLNAQGQNLLLHARRIVGLQDEAMASFRSPEIQGEVRIGVCDDNVIVLDAAWQPDDESAQPFEKTLQVWTEHLPPGDLPATWRWLLDGTGDTSRDRLGNTYVLARLSDAAGERDAAMALYRRLQSASGQRGSIGRSIDAAIKRPEGDATDN